LFSTLPSNIIFVIQNNGVLKYNRIEDYTYWITSGTNLLIGYLLVSNYKRVSGFLNNKLN